MAGLYHTPPLLKKFQILGTYLDDLHNFIERIVFYEKRKGLRYTAERRLPFCSQGAISESYSDRPRLLLLGTRENLFETDGHAGCSDLALGLQGTEMFRLLACLIDHHAAAIARSADDDLSGLLQLLGRRDGIGPLAVVFAETLIEAAAAGVGSVLPPRPRAADRPHRALPRPEPAVATSNPAGCEVSTRRDL